MTPAGATRASTLWSGPTRAWFVTSSLETGRRQVEGAAQTSPSASDPTGGMDETQCEGSPKGSIDTNAGLQVPCNPASSLERATGIEPATSSLGISFPPPHVMSLPIRIQPESGVND